MPPGTPSPNESQAPMGILLLDPHTGGGGQVRYVMSLAVAFRDRGHRVAIGCRAESVLARRAREAGIPLYDGFQFRRGLRLGAWIRDIRLLRRLLREQRFDLLHVNGSQDHWVAAFAKLLGGAFPALLRTRHNTYRVPVHFVNAFLNRRLTDHQICVCEEVRENLASLPVFDATRMCAIHNGVDPVLYRADATLRDAARKELGYAPDDFVFGIAARLNKAKGHEFLFRAAACLRDAYPRMRLLLLGDGELEAPLHGLARELQIEERVCFAGFREDMPRMTQAFDAGVLPSIDCDTSSFSLKEEMAAGKPVIASDYGGLKEIVRDGVEGLVVPAGTHEPLAEAMRRLMDDPALCEALGSAGRERVLREFSLDVFADRTLAVYRQVIARRHAHPSS